MMQLKQEDQPKDNELYVFYVFSCLRLITLIHQVL